MWVDDAPIQGYYRASKLVNTNYLDQCCIYTTVGNLPIDNDNIIGETVSNTGSVVYLQLRVCPNRPALENSIK
jgi:hypothetical protein